MAGYRSRHHVTHWSTCSSKAGDGGGRRAVLSEIVVFSEQL